MIFCLNFMGFDFVADVDYTVTSYGSPAHMGSLSYPGHPGEPPEWEVDGIVLHRDDPPNMNLTLRSIVAEPGFEATGALFDCLANNYEISEAICEDIFNNEGRDRQFDETRDAEIQRQLDKEGYRYD